MRRVVTLSLLGVDSVMKPVTVSNLCWKQFRVIRNALSEKGAERTSVADQVSIGCFRRHRHADRFMSGSRDFHDHLDSGLHELYIYRTLLGSWFQASTPQNPKEPEPPQGTVVWVQILQGQVNLLGFNGLELMPDLGRIPLEMHLWLQASDIVELDYIYGKEITDIDSLLNGG